MFIRSIFSAILTLCIVAPSSAFAEWTGWVDLANRNEVNSLADRIGKINGQRLAPKRVRCKADKNSIYINVDYRAVRAGGIYYIDADYWKNLETKDRTLKRHSANVLSRSDVETNKGLFTCIIWLKPQW